MFRKKIGVESVQLPPHPVTVMIEGLMGEDGVRH